MSCRSVNNFPANSLLSSERQSLIFTDPLGSIRIETGLTSASSNQRTHGLAQRHRFSRQPAKLNHRAQ